MTTWVDYIDESYNSRTICVGGLIARDDTWGKLEASWKQRIAYENRMSARKNYPPISRYHATDCANLKREFSEKKGWNIPRQILFTKRLCSIMGSHELAGIVIGGKIDDFKKSFPEEESEFRKGLYHLSLKMHFVEVAHVMRKHFPDDRVTIYYDRGKEFGGVVRETFDSFMDETDGKHLSRYFVTCAPMGWEDCVPLQPADLWAYEGMKRMDLVNAGNDSVRKSLRALIRADLPLVIKGFNTETYASLLQRIRNKSKEQE